MSKEVKVGLLAIVTILVSIWGYRFLKGKNLFDSTNNFYTTFEDVTKLPNSAAVYLNGYKVGQVTGIKINADDVKKMDVFFTVSGDIPFPKDGKVTMKNDGILGDRILTLDFDKACQGGDCATDGAYVQNNSVGLLGSVLGANEASEYVSQLSKDAQLVISSLGAEGSQGKLNDIIRNLDITVAKIAELSEATSNLIQSSQSTITQTIRNLEAITNNIEASNKEITNTLTNVSKLSSSLADGKIDNMLSNTNTMVNDASKTLKSLEATSTQLKSTISALNTTLDKINNGNGSISSLLTDRSLYDNLNNTSTNLSLLLQDLRLNPKRYVNVSVFGRKNPPYTLPEDDPASHKD